MSLAYALAPYIFSDRDPDASGGGEGRDFGRPSSRPIVDPREAEIAERIRGGDEMAMRELVLTYADALTRFAMVLLREQSAAEAMAYDVLADLWIRRDKILVDRSLKSYLFTSVRRRALDVLARGRTRERYVEETYALYDARIWSAPSPETLLFEQGDETTQAARIALLKTAVDALPERRRLVVHLRFEQGMTYPAIGEVLGLSDKAAQQLVLRTVATLRKALGM